MTTLTADLQRQHVRDHVIPEACVTDREPWPCTIAQLLALLATAEPGEAGLRAALDQRRSVGNDEFSRGWNAGLDEGSRVALRAPVADVGLDVERLAKALGNIAERHGRPTTVVVALADAIEIDAAYALAATPTEPPADSRPTVWIEDPNDPLLTIPDPDEPRVNGDGFTPEQQKALDFARDDAARAQDNHAEPYPGNTADAEADR